MKRAIILGVIASLILNGTTSSAFSINKLNQDNSKNNIIIIDEDYFDSIKDKINVNILDRNNIIPYTNIDNESTGERIYGVNYNDFSSKENVKKQAKQLIDDDENVYLYGQDLDIQVIENQLDIDIDGYDAKEEAAKGGDISPIQESKWNIIGIENGTATYFAHLQSYDYDDNAIEPKLDTYIDVIANGKDNLKGNTSDIAILSANETVYSEYDLNDYLYKDDQWGNSILRAQLNADYIMYQNLSEDSDDTYDYFYLKNNVELYTNSGKGCTGNNITVTHTLPFSSDELEDWGPTSSSDDDTFTVSLPWGVAWTFNAYSNIDIETSGSQANDTVTYEAYNHSLMGYYPFDDDNVRIQPGTAWASTGTYAGINTEASAEVDYGVNTYSLSLSDDIRYQY
ncbi:MAG: hypothetical protein WCD89_09140 [Anaerocolumna sp.]